MHRSVCSAIALISIVSACKSPAAGQRRWVTCTCEYVTDFDQPGKVTVDVCSEGAPPTTSAESCARNAGVGAVTGCICASARGGGCDQHDLCREPPSQVR